MRISSIDPGKKGSLALIQDGQPLEFVDMPMAEGGKLIDPKAIAVVLWRWSPDHIVVEKVASSPRMGATSAFNFGCNSYGLVCLAAGMKIPCHTITPQKWKTVHGLINKPKDASRLLALKMFPQLKENLKRVKDIDRADALLMGLAWLKMEVSGI